MIHDRGPRLVGTWVNCWLWLSAQSPPVYAVVCAAVARSCVCCVRFEETKKDGQEVGGETREARQWIRGLRRGWAARRPPAAFFPLGGEFLMPRQCGGECGQVSTESRSGRIWKSTHRDHFVNSLSQQITSSRLSVWLYVDDPYIAIHSLKLALPFFPYISRPSLDS